MSYRCLAYSHLEKSYLVFVHTKTTNKIVNAKKMSAKTIWPYKVINVL